MGKCVAVAIPKAAWMRCNCCMGRYPNLCQQVMFLCPPTPLPTLSLPFSFPLSCHIIHSPLSPTASLSFSLRAARHTLFCCLSPCCTPSSALFRHRPFPFLPFPCPLSRPAGCASVPMVMSRVGPRGLGAGDSPGQPGPAWTAVWAAYTTVFIPLSSSLCSSEALQFFLWVSGRIKTGGRQQVGLAVGQCVDWEPNVYLWCMPHVNIWTRG